MRAGRRDEDALLRRSVADAAAELPRLLDRLADGPRDAGRGLGRGLEQLRLDPHIAAGGSEHLVEPRCEVQAVRVEQLELLLDAEAERRARPVVDLHRAAPYPGPPAGNPQMSD